VFSVFLVEANMRIAIGGILHESNTFAPASTPLAAFGVRRGEEIVAAHRDTFHEVAGFLRGGAECGLDLVPTLLAGATPAGTVAADAFETLVGELVERLREVKPLDGVLLALHGAMAVEGFPDGDGEVVRRVREALGPELPLVVTHDFHANISDQLVDLSTALVVYRTNPHVDQRERGEQAARLLARTLRGVARPTQALARPPMLLNILHQNTSAEPLRSILAEAAALEAEPGVLAVNVAGGYQYADVFEVGPSVVVVTNDGSAQARKLAERLSDRLWEARDRLRVDLPGPAEAVRRATSPPAPLLEGEGCLDPLPRLGTPPFAGEGQGERFGPVVLVDMGDNIGGGSAGDSTFLLVELLAQNAPGWVMTLADPAAVVECVRAGVGQPVSLSVGGKTDRLHGLPAAVKGRVRLLHEGTYEDGEVRHGGQRRYDQGLTAVLEIECQASAPMAVPNIEYQTSNTTNPASCLVLTSRRHPPFSLEQLVSLGIRPERQRILVVKAAIAYRAAYEPIAGRIIEVNSPGLTCVDPSAFTYTRARRPLWGAGREGDLPQ
jgi:microcystin degradation protein MlrC